jgi:hypothetical protein
MPDIIEISWIQISSLLAALAIIVPIILYTLSKQKKGLICRLYHALSLVDVRTEVRDKIKIYYNENLVENLSRMIVKIRNNGNLPIRKKDIVKPLSFNFGENLSVIDYSVINTEPKGITVSLESNAENNLISCFFDLLNPSDELTLQFVCLGESNESPLVGARIEGVKQVDVVTEQASEVIKVAEKMRKGANRDVVIGFLVLIGSFILCPALKDIAFLILFAVLGIILIISGIVFKKRSHYWQKEVGVFDK